ncbi:MAG: hypothetical protein WC497_01525 [Patescibacteria group bacterium]
MEHKPRTDLIKSGVTFEEEFVNVLARRIAETREFGELDEEKKDKIINILDILLNESVRHGKLLQNILDKY